MSWNKLSYILFEEKETLSFDLSDIKCSVTHPTFPIIFAGSKGQVLVIYSKTMAVIAVMEAGKRGIQKILINNCGDRVIAIDRSGRFFMWRYNLVAKNFKPKLDIATLDAVDCSFISDNSRIIVASKKHLILIDTLEGEQLAENFKNAPVLDEFSGITHILYSPHLRYCIVVLGKKSKIILFDIDNRMKLETVDVQGGADIISVERNSIGTIFAVGLGDGRVLVY